MTSPPVLWSSYCPIFSFLCSILSMTVFCPFSVGHCIVCPLASDYLFDIFICWPLHCLSIGFWLHLWHLYLLAIVLSVHWFLITPLTSLSVGHCIVCALVSDYLFDIFICWPLHCLSIGFWLPLLHLYLLAIALSVHWLLITSDIFICWPLHCLCIGFWLPLWHLFLLAIALSVHWLLITSLTSFAVGHCIVCPLVSDYIFDIFFCWPLHCLSIGFWLHLWHLYLLAIALSVHWLLITSLTSFSN